MTFRTTFQTNLDHDSIPDTVEITFGTANEQNEVPMDVRVDSSQDIFVGEEKGGSVRFQASEKLSLNGSQGLEVIKVVPMECDMDVQMQRPGNRCIISNLFSIPLPPSKIPQGISLLSQEGRQITDQIRNMGVHLEMEKECYETSGGFTLGELKDIREVLETYQREIGDLKRFQIKLNIYRYYRESSSCELEAQGPVTHTCDPLETGPAFKGQTEMKGELRISIVAKDLLDAHQAWRAANQLDLHGQEGQKRNFKWTLIHEIAHQISYRIGCGYEFANEEKITEFGKAWIILHQEIKKACPLPKATTNFISRYTRHPGYPSDYSTTNESGGGTLGEIWADTVTYILTDSHYADKDEWFLKRVQLVKDFLKSIKK